MNCRTLWGKIALYTALTNPISTVEYYEEAHGHKIYRRVELYDNKADLPEGWNGITRIAKVRRWGERNNKPFEEVSFYILSKPETHALKVAIAIQEHWGIENLLHWPKDAIMKEDDMTLRTKNAVSIIAYMNNIVLNLIRNAGQKVNKDTFALYTNRVDRMADLFFPNRPR